MTPVDLIPDAEQVLGAYLRTHPDVEALEARVAGRTPDSQVMPWVRVTQLDATDDPTSGREHLIDYLMQFDCYAGQDATAAHTAQHEASTLARTVRAALKAMQGTIVDDMVVCRVRFVSMPRIPDVDYEPARERYILTATIQAHPAA